MATTDIDVASQALGLLRADTISSFTEGTNEADIANLYYGTFVKDIFSRYPWSFALNKKKLNQDATTPVNEWSYRHIIPAETEIIWAVYNSGQSGAIPFKNYDILQNYVYSNETEIWAEYTVYSSEENWPGYFIQYAIHAFAAMIALPVTDDEDLANRWQVVAYGTPSENERGGKFGIAAGADSKQKPPERFKSHELIAARFS